MSKRKQLSKGFINSLKLQNPPLFHMWKWITKVSVLSPLSQSSCVISNNKKERKRERQRETNRETERENKPKSNSQVNAIQYCHLYKIWEKNK